MYNYTIIAYGIKIPENFCDFVSQCDLTEFDMMISPYNGSLDYEIGIGYEISDTDFGSNFIKDILEFKEENFIDKYKEDLKILIDEILSTKDDIIEYYPEKLLNDFIDYINNQKPELIRIEATS